MTESILATVTVAAIPPPPTDGFQIGPLFIHIYGIAIALGVLAAFWLTNRRWRALGRRSEEMEPILLGAVVAGFIGGRIGYIIPRVGTFDPWWEAFAIWQGGLALYGGLTLGVGTGLYLAWRRGIPPLLALDVAIPAIPLAQMMGRWGNYFNQELFGTPTTLPWALEVEPAFRPAEYVEFATFHPTFLYESLYNALVVVALLWLSRNRTLRPGSLALYYGVLYGTARFLLELIRTDTTFRLVGLSRNAWVSLIVIVGCLALLYWREVRRGGQDHVPARKPAPVPVAVGADSAAAVNGDLDVDADRDGDGDGDAEVDPNASAPESSGSASGSRSDRSADDPDTDDRDTDAPDTETEAKAEPAKVAAASSGADATAGDTTAEESSEDRRETDGSTGSSSG